MKTASLLIFVVFASLFLSSACEPRCETHADCMDDEVCMFSRHTCVIRCDPNVARSCGMNYACVPCASSSCETCTDCIPACVLVGGNQPAEGGWR